jgi:hypothetical protein
MRLKIIDKSKTNGDINNKNIVYSESFPAQAIHSLCTKKMLFQPNNGAGYAIVLEGIMPYDTADGTLNFDVLTDKEDLFFEQLEMIEPLEYTDKYYTSKYGILFKEKIFVIYKIVYTIGWRQLSCFFPY